MIDRDEVLTWLTICGENSDCSGCCPYHAENNHEGSIECMSALMRDALKLLKGQWISVEDRLPETSQEVLTFSRTEKSGTGYMSIVLYSAKFKAFNCTDDCDEYKVKNVTYWMPLPKAPEE